MGILKRNAFRKGELELLPVVIKKAIRCNYIECPSCGVNQQGYILPKDKKYIHTKEGMHAYCKKCKQYFYVDVEINENYRKQYIAYKHQKKLEKKKGASHANRQS